MLMLQALQLAMPVSLSGVSGISAIHFRTCRSLDELLNFPSRTG